MQTRVPEVEGFIDLTLIGRGGFSTVYQAVQADLGRPVAIKVLDVGVNEEAARRRFERECRVVGVLNGVPGIASVYQSAYTADGRPCIVMEHMANGSLEEYVRANGPVLPRQALEVGEVIGAALASAHDRGVVHRDIKPGNVLISDSGNVALADFGISTVEHVASSSRTAASLSPPHAPPERFRGDPADERLADIYSLGSTVYFACTGRAPFGTSEEGGLSGLMDRVANHPPTPIGRDDLPSGLEELIVRMMAKDPSDRPPSAAVVSEEFARLARGIDPVGVPDATLAVAAAGGVTNGTAEQTDDDRIVIPPPPATLVADVVSVSASLDDLDDVLPEGLAEVSYPPGTWPTGLDYTTAIQDPDSLLPELRSGNLVRDMLGMPMSASGQSAIVFQLEGDDGPVALRCFTRPPEHGAVRYRALARHIERRPCDALVAARWVDEAITVDGRDWPAVSMPWVPGLPLNIAVEDLLGQPAKLLGLAARWLDVVDSMRAAGIAHGDLQNGNVLVDEDLTIRLVDLDGVWVPALRTHPPIETGHPDFQHPNRRTHHWGPEVDAFAGFVIHMSLRALAADPSLWEHHAGENLVLGAADFRCPGATAAWEHLNRSPDPEVRRWTGLLREICTAATPPEGFVSDLLPASPLFTVAGIDDEADLTDRTVKRTRAQVERTAAEVRAALGIDTAAVGENVTEVDGGRTGTDEYVPSAFVPKTPTVAEETEWWRSTEQVPSAGPAPVTSSPPAPVANASSMPPPVVPPSPTRPAPSPPWYDRAEGALGGMVIGLVCGGIVWALRSSIQGALVDPFERDMPGLSWVVAPALALILLCGAMSALSDLRMKFARGAVAKFSLAFLCALAAVGGVGLLLGWALSGVEDLAITIVVWSVLGPIVGLLIALFGSSFRPLTGVLGGLLAGAVGGLVSTAVRYWIHGPIRIGLGTVLGTVVFGTLIALIGRASRRTWLAVVDGPLAGRELVLEGDVALVGTGRRCKVVIPQSPDVEAEHLALRWGRHRALLDARGATWLNGHRVGGLVDIADGDQVRAGSTTFVFHRRAS